MAKHKIVDKKYLLPFILVTSLFYLWAIPNNLNDILIPQFMKSFELNRLQAGLVQSAFYMGYFLLSLPAAYIMDRYNYKTGLLIGLILYAMGAFLFYPAAVVGTYGMFLLALFVIASGLAFLETGSNSFIAVLGDPATSTQRLNFSQSFNPWGAMSGALIGNVFIFSGIEHSQSQVDALKASGQYQSYLHSEILRVIPPYMVIGVIILVIAFVMWKVKFPAESETGTHRKMDTKKEGSHGHFSKLFQYPHFVKGVIAQFFYVGAQVGTWSFMISYVKDYLQRPEKEAGYFLFASLLAFGVGRFASTALMRKINPHKLMGAYSLINVALVAVSVVLPGQLGGYALVASSFFMSLMFPTIFAFGVKGLGPNTKIGGSMIIMAIIGGAVWTPIMGLISDQTKSLALAMIVPLICYIYIFYYAIKGSIPSGPLYEQDEAVIASH
ncbi:MAG: L-fucose:H+ symporter permease [Bacteroidota bacterium]|nr:L-fucose:H+ symporter permease [Bacteroidota bacterium]MDP4270167.1 L-fucose:H+ symporter permease [Bacteroidota bacterium]